MSFFTDQARKLQRTKGTTIGQCDSCGCLTDKLGTFTTEFEEIECCPRCAELHREADLAEIYMIAAGYEPPANVSFVAFDFWGQSYQTCEEQQDPESLEFEFRMAFAEDIDRYRGQI